MKFLLQYTTLFALTMAMAMLFVVYWLRQFAQIAGWPTTWRYIGRYSTFRSLARRFTIVLAGGLLLALILGAMGLVITFTAALTVLIR
jgi:hypothetical protein